MKKLFIMFHMMTVSLRDRLSHAPLVVNSPRTLDTSCMVFTRKPIPSYGMGGVWGVEGGGHGHLCMCGCQQRQVIGCHVWRCETGQRTMTGGATHLPNVAVTS